MHYLDSINEVLQSLGDLLGLKTIMASLLGLSVFLIGTEALMPFYALMALMVFDLITGTAVAWREEKISSRRAVKTPFKFAVYLMLVSAAHLSDVAVFGGAYIQETMIAFLALTEFISILENTGKLGFAIPKKLLKRLEQIRDTEFQDLRADRNSRNARTDRNDRTDRNRRNALNDENDRADRNASR